MTRRLLILFILFSTGITILLGANPYKIHATLYDLYSQAYENRFTPRGVELADSMYRKATQMKDKQAQCLALTIPVIYLSTTDTVGTEMEVALRKLQKTAKDNGYSHYYYVGMNIKVDYLLKRKQQSEALRYIMHSLRVAQKDNDLNGLYAGYRALAKVYLLREEFNLSAEAYRDAIKIAQKSLPQEDIGKDYMGLVQCYKYTGNYEKMRKNALWGIRYAKTDHTHHPLRVALAYALFMEDKYSEFLTQYAKVQQERNSLLDEEYASEYTELEIQNLILSAEYEKAADLIPQVRPMNLQLRLLCALNMKQANYKEAVENMSRLFRLRNTNAQTVFTQDITLMNAKFNNQQLENEKKNIALRNTQLELSNTQLALTNSSLELARIKNKEHVAQLNADNASLAFKNHMLITKRQQDSLQNQQRIREANNRELKIRNNILGILLGLASFGLGLMCLIIYNRWRMNKKLRQANKDLKIANEQLVIAKDKVQQADRMKTMFIQNMSHEIRTPLNAIVGFSDLLSDDSFPLGNDEKNEMRTLVKENSELLTTIINDILDITALESGKYVMKIADVNINTLCRKAIKTVEGRAIKGVELIFDSKVSDSLTVRTDAQRVKQVLINLLNNAEKNTTEGYISLNVEQMDYDQLQFTVTDTGVGIPPEKMDVIFERFKKLDIYKQGSGLGLSICQTIAEKLGGSICVDKNYRNGARFIFSIRI